MKPKWWQLLRKYKAWRRKGSNARANVDPHAELTSVTNFEELVAVATRGQHSSENVHTHPEPKFWKNFYEGIGFDTVREIITECVRLNGALETAGSIAGQIGGADFDLTDAVAHEPVVLDALDRLQMDLLPPSTELELV